MPNRAQRREEDGRAPRFESEVRQSEATAPDFAAKRKFYCSPEYGGCGRLFEEKSKVCPRCERGKTMGELRHREMTEAEQARSVARARAGRGASLPGQGR